MARETAVIDCDIHPQIADAEEIVAYVEPAQREWFRAQGGTLGLPGYTWAHPHSFFRQDLETDGRGVPGASPDAVGKELLDVFATDAGVLNADDAITVSLMANPYRAAELARAHNDWIRERWLDVDPRLRGAIVCPAQDPLAAAAEIRRAADDDRFVQVLLVAGSERPYGEPRYLPIFEAAAELGLPVAIHSGGDGMGIAAPGGGAGAPTFYIEWHTLGLRSSQGVSDRRARQFVSSRHRIPGSQATPPSIRSTLSVGRRSKTPFTMSDTRCAIVALAEPSVCHSM